MPRGKVDRRAIEGRITTNEAPPLPAVHPHGAAWPQSLAPLVPVQPAVRGTGDLGLIIERASGSLLLIETTVGP